VNQPALPIIEKLLQERMREVGTLSVNQAGQRIALPLRTHRIVARAADAVAEVTVEQSFQNPFQEFLEAVYTFPLGGAAAVCTFEMKVGDRTLKGIVKERSEARLDYWNALEEGKRAALLEQERDDIFTVQVGNLPPGEEVSVRIVYSERLSYLEDGMTELRLPLVVAPRYIPGEPLDGVRVGGGVESDTDVVPDGSRISPPRLAPGLDPKVALSVEVELADCAGAEMACSQHAVKLANGRISLSREDEPLNRDFVLRWRRPGIGIQSRLLVNGSGFAMLSLVAPRRDGSLGTPRDVVFVLDRSGSMEGAKMASAARACSILLWTLGPQDNFAVCAFSNSTDWMQWTPADEGGIAAGEKFLRAIMADGGTELGPALDKTLKQIRSREETTGREPVIVLITDGQVGNEAEIFKRVQGKSAGVRVFTVGIDTAVNAAFLQRLASLAGGTCTCCVPGEALEQALAAISREIGAPVITGIQIDGADLIAPARTPELFAGRASTSFFVGQNLKQVFVQGKYADGTDFNVIVKAEPIDLPAISHLWARARVADLEDRFRLGENVKQEMIDLAVKHTLLTRFTAFVVVDEGEVVNEKGTHRTVVQPVEMPDRWEAALSIPSEPSFELPLLCDFMQSDASRRTPEYVNPRKVLYSGGGTFDKLRRTLGWKPSQPVTRGDGLSATEKRVAVAHREAIEKAFAALTKALKDVGSRLKAGMVSDAEPIEQARKDLLNALARSGSGVRFEGLERFLRGTLVELITALPSGSAGAVLPILDRVQKEFIALAREHNFWEAGV
jgi:Ca-activated chloride channel homolog